MTLVACHLQHCTAGRTFNLDADRHPQKDLHAVLQAAGSAATRLGRLTQSLALAIRCTPYSTNPNRYHMTYGIRMLFRIPCCLHIVCTQY
jgi:hypothetical protein